MASHFVRQGKAHHQHLVNVDELLALRCGSEGLDENRVYEWLPLKRLRARGN